MALLIAARKNNGTKAATFRQKRCYELMKVEQQKQQRGKKKKQQQQQQKRRRRKNKNKKEKNVDECRIKELQPGIELHRVDDDVACRHIFNYFLLILN